MFCFLRLLLDLSFVITLKAKKQTLYRSKVFVLTQKIIIL